MATRQTDHGDALLSIEPVEVPGTSASEDDQRRAVLEKAHELSKTCDVHCKEHEISSEDWALRRDVLGLLVAAFSAVTTAAAFTELFGELFGTGTVPGVLSLAVTVGTAVMTFLAPGEKVAHHRIAADQYGLLHSDIDLYLRIRERQAKTSDLVGWIESEYEQFKKIHLSRPEISDRVRTKAKELTQTASGDSRSVGDSGRTGWGRWWA
jgi:hypothetical protein